MQSHYLTAFDCYDMKLQARCQLRTTWSWHYTPDCTASAGRMLNAGVQQRSPEAQGRNLHSTAESWTTGLQHSEQHPRAEPTQNAGSPASHLPASARRGAVGHARRGAAGTLVPAAGMGVKLKLVANLPTTLPKHPTKPEPPACCSSCRCGGGPSAFRGAEATGFRVHWVEGTLGRGWDHFGLEERSRRGRACVAKP